MSSSSPDQSKFFVELRGSPRREQRKRAKAIIDKLALNVDCTVRDISETGAGMESESIGAVPDNFDLQIGKDEPIPVDVVWRAGRRFGVRFKSDERVGELLDDMAGLYAGFEEKLSAFVDLAREARGLGEAAKHVSHVELDELAAHADGLAGIFRKISERRT